MVGMHRVLQVGSSALALLALGTLSALPVLGAEEVRSFVVRGTVDCGPCISTSFSGRMIWVAAYGVPMLTFPL